jgi:hypothetical protein
LGSFARHGRSGSARLRQRRTLRLEDDLEALDGRDARLGHASSARAGDNLQSARGSSQREPKRQQQRSACGAGMRRWRRAAKVPPVR